MKEKYTLSEMAKIISKSSHDPAGLFSKDLVPSIPSVSYNSTPAVDTHISKFESQEQLNKYIELFTPFEICDFNDECDFCGNPNHKQSWAKMSGFPAETDYYICEDCIMKDIDKFKNMV